MSPANQIQSEVPFENIPTNEKGDETEIRFPGCGKGAKVGFLNCKSFELLEDSTPPSSRLAHCNYHTEPQLCG
jgi:hypothetical protein